MISHHHQLIFVHIPKCAGMAVELALGGLPVPQRSEQHFTGHQYRRYHPELWGRFARFALVRDPIRRCLSYTRFFRRWDATWRRRLRHVPDEVLLRDQLMSVNMLTTHSAHRMLTGEETVLKLEEIRTAWPAFARPRGLPDALPRHNASPQPTRREHVSPATQLMIAARFPEDFSRFGYPLPDVALSDLPLEDQGSVLWARLLQWALRHQEPGAATAAARDALQRWVESLPDPRWVIRWKVAVERRPPPLEPRGNLVLWSEHIHDDLHRALGKPLWEPWSPLGEEHGGRVAAESDILRG